MKLFYTSLLLLSLLLTWGCREQSSKPAHDHHSGHDHGSESGETTYQEGKGLQIPEAVSNALGLESLEVKEGTLQPEITFTAQIYRSAQETSKQYGKERSSKAYATSFIAPETASLLKPHTSLVIQDPEKKHSSLVAMIWKIDSTQTPTLGKVELLLEIEDSRLEWKIGDSFQAICRTPNSNTPALTIPSESVLKSTQGEFVFVKNGDYWLRTEIKTGRKNSREIEVMEGLYEGDTIAVKPVETLYLIELRAVKGGGHCH